MELASEIDQGDIAGPILSALCVLLAILLFLLYVCCLYKLRCIAFAPVAECNENKSANAWMKRHH
jgi:hypothetical protein